MYGEKALKSKNYILMLKLFAFMNWKKSAWKNIKLWVYAKFSFYIAGYYMRVV